MSRIKLLVVAVAIGLSGYLFLTAGAQRQYARIEEASAKRVDDAKRALSPSLRQTVAAELAAAKQLAATPGITKALDESGKPTAKTLEAAIDAMGRLPEALGGKPDLLLILAGGSTARYLVGASNRFDRGAQAIAVVGGASGGPRTLIGAIDGRVYQLAVAPLFAEDTVAPGELALGFALNDGLAHRLSAAIGSDVDVSFLSNQKIVGSTLASVNRRGIATAAHPGKLGFEFGALTDPRFALTDLVPPTVKLPPLPLGVGPLAANHGILLPLDAPGVALVLSSRTLGALADLADDQRLVLGGLAGLIALCLILAAFGGNPAKGLERIAGTADKLALGDLTARAPTERLAPGVRRLAVALNAIAANAAARSGVAPSPEVAAKGTSNLSPAPLSPEAFAGAPGAIGVASPLPSPPLAVGPAAQAKAEPFVEAPAVLQGSPPPSAHLSPASHGETDFGGLFDSPAAPPPQVATTAAPSASPAPTPVLASRAEEQNPDATVVAETPEALVRATRLGPTGSTSPGVRRPESTQTASRPAPGPSRMGVTRTGSVALPAASPTSEEGHFQAVYRDFIATRSKCGEAADGLSFDRFAQKLRKNREQLVAKYACKSVRFQVYVKEGKAALKATPVRD